jgi:hypothetical protein
MTATATATMIVICGIIWGGFAGLVVYAAKRERGRSDAPEDTEG